MAYWQIITGEYPPVRGGVSDYTGQVARALTESGEQVTVYVPRCIGSPRPNYDRGVRIEELKSNFGFRELWTLRNRVTKADPASIVLIQYVPHAFGYRALNLPFCLWLVSLRKRALWIMFHEVAFPISARQTAKHNLLGLIQNLMAAVASRSASRILVSTTAWQRLLPKKCDCLPVPSNIPVVERGMDAVNVKSQYAPGSSLIGHFGTFNSSIADLLFQIIPAVLLASPQANMLLIGPGSIEFSRELTAANPSMAGRIRGTGSLEPSLLSIHLAACDVMLQPYSDGITTRRSTVMAALSHGKPVISNAGHLTEPIWHETQAVVLCNNTSPAKIAAKVITLLNDSHSRREQGTVALRAYNSHFSLQRTIDILRNPVLPSKTSNAPIFQMNHSSGNLDGRDRQDTQRPDDYTAGPTASNGVQNGKGPPPTFAAPKQKPSLLILYGQAPYHSTSLQTAHLCQVLESSFSVASRVIEPKKKSGLELQARRVWSNLGFPRFRKCRTDYLLYGNDGFADLSHWPGTKILYWYDAPSNWSLSPPSIRNYKDFLRYKNVKGADFVFAVSAAQVEVAKALRPGREHLVHYLPVGADCSFFNPDKFDGQSIKSKYKIPAKPVIGYLGYIGLVAGRYAGQCLAEVAPYILANYDAHFLIVGFGPGLKSFQQQVAEYRIANHFTFTGHIPHEALPDYLAAMDICVDTLEEGFHSEARSETKLKHYMAMGRACVATAIGENCVDLEDGRCGVLVAPDNDDLRRGIQICLVNPDLRQNLGAAARKRAETVYDWKRLGARMLSALQIDPTSHLHKRLRPTYARN